MIVAFDKVFGRDGHGPSGRPTGFLRGVSLALDVGLHALCGGAGDGVVAFGELCEGRCRPRAGSVTVLGRRPHQSPAARREIVVVHPQPDLPPLGRVSRSVAAIAAARGIDGRAALDRFELGGALWSRPVAQLELAEARAVELALALASPCRLLCVYEPFQHVALDHGRLRHALTEAAAAACVVVAVSDPGDVAGLAAHLHVFEQGRLVGSDAAVGWPELDKRQLSLWLEEPDARIADAAAALGRAAAIDGVTWTSNDGGGVLQLRVRDVDAAARAVAQLVRDEALQLTALRAGSPTRADILAEASRRAARAAQEARAAQAAAEARAAQAAQAAAGEP